MQEKDLVKQLFSLNILVIFIIYLFLHVESVKVAVMSNSLQPHRVHGILQARIMEWVAFLFSRRSSQPRDRTQVSHVAGRFFTSCSTREAQEYCSGFPIPSPADLPDPVVKPGYPALQVNSLPTSYQGSPYRDPQNLAV